MMVDTATSALSRLEGETLAKMDVTARALAAGSEMMRLRVNYKFAGGLTF